MRACRRQPTEYTPIWLMRQAGRFMPEYRNLRSRYGFLELCKNSTLAAEITVNAAKSLGVDAAIIFADLLLPFEPMGIKLEYGNGDGPVIHNPVCSQDDVKRLRPFIPEESLSFVMEAIKLTRRELPEELPLIGFAGAPFTLASYLIEGSSGRHYERTKAFMYREPEGWHKLMSYLADITASYLNAQINAGVQLIQLFDSWAGCLNKIDYQEFVLPYSRTLLAAIPPKVPTIHFATESSHLLTLMKEAGGDVIGLDWRVNLREAWDQIGPNIAVQGNLDPCVLLAEPEYISKAAMRILKQANGQSGHIFNLGHGILPSTPLKNVKMLVETVHEQSQR